MAVEKIGEDDYFPRVDNCGSGIEVRGALTDDDIEALEKQQNLFKDGWCNVHFRGVMMSCSSKTGKVKAACREFNCPHYRE